MTLKMISFVDYVSLVVKEMNILIEDADQMGQLFLLLASSSFKDGVTIGYALDRDYRTVAYDIHCKFMESKR